MPDNSFATLDRAALRRALLAQRQAIAPEVRSQWNLSIGMQATRLVAVERIGMLGIYWPIRGEPDLLNFYAEMATGGTRLCLPIVQAAHAPLRFAAWQPGDALSRDGFGVPVPAQQQFVEPQALLIPCVGFNSRNYRLGYGGGFYDRTLAALPTLRTIGIAYAQARVEFDPQPHDRALGLVITEEA